VKRGKFKVDELALNPPKTIRVEDLDSTLKEQETADEQEDVRPSRELPVDPEPTGKHEWKMVGQVTDENGVPLADVEARMATGLGTLQGGGQTKTDAQGNYELIFGEGILSFGSESNMQVAWYFISKLGYVYQSNSRGVDLSMGMVSGLASATDQNSISIVKDILVNYVVNTIVDQ